MLEIDEAQNGNAFTVETGDVIGLKLSENPSTGYRWRICCEIGPILEVLQDKFAPSSSLPGAFGSRTWRFKIMQPGHADIKMERRRSWETRAVETFNVSIDARLP